MAPGLLWNVADTSTSAFGTTYDVRPRTCVSHPYAAWQYGLTGDTVEPFSPAPNALVPVVVVASSGSRARTSQLSATVCPVLEPPTSTKRLPRRMWAVTSTPLNDCDHEPYRSALSPRLLTCPDFAGTTS